ncbi:MAG: hypothetical protein IKE94_16070 [Aeriscardovia sp.]|nr:hypothetical protein [Aeriscardovia sp.]MBR3359734.1 hypothetical protein [Lachnospiraceae bacterium]MBR7077080.1 hypothetical protein [Lachnospiraceae bacterium]MDO4206560.1 hypothetical protein [Lachnospiraceae bacterium]
MKKKILAALLTFAIVLTIFAPLTVQAAKTGWNEIDGKWKYYYSTSSYYTDTIQCINDEYYCFDEEGWMQVGWIARYSDWYYAKSNGVLANGWEKVNGKWYYFEPGSCYMHYDEILWDGDNDYFLSESGAMLTGWIKKIYDYGGGSTYTAWYYADSSGKLAKRWKWINDAWYYFSDYGVMYAGSLYHIDSVPYYFYPNGKLGIGWIRQTYSFDGGEVYTSWLYSNSSGVVQREWQNINGTWYYFDDYWGDMYTGSHEINGQWYVFLNSGAWVSWPGWVKVTYDDGYWDWYYTNSDGTPQFGWQKIGGIWYYFYDFDASLVYSSTYEDDGKLYAFDQSGALLYGNGWKKLPQWDGTALWVYLENNYAKTGWLDGGNGTWYYLHPGNGYMEDAACKIGDYLSLFNSNGVWQGYYKTPGWKKAGEYWYYIRSNGTVYTGWLTIAGKQYYLDPDDGYMYADGWYTIGEKEYQFDANGVCVDSL